MLQLTITNHSELYPEVLNSLNKSASNEMSECLHDKIRKHAMKQNASQTKSVFPRSRANFLSRGLFILPLAHVAFKKVMLKLKEQLAANCVAIIARFRNTKASALHYRISTVLSKLTRNYSLREKSERFL